VHADDDPATLDTKPAPISEETPLGFENELR
jgi:hypothetical protein